jgi:hypothetical protein
VNPAPPSLERTRLIAATVGVVGTFLLMAVLVWAMYHYTRPEPLAAIRARERAQFLQEVRATEAKALSEYAWQDQAKGFVRLPLARALELTLQEWQQPAAARSNLIARVEKATEKPPPPPAPVNPYE